MSDDLPTVRAGLRDSDVARLRASLRETEDEDLFDGRFEIVREAGAGGMGKVYEAIERETSRRVAIKVITGLPGPDERARFAAEIEVIERLDHPAIVDYVACGETSRGEPYLAMEWLTGESLADRLKRDRLSIEEAAVLGERIAEALDHAHRAGVVHRDLKPSNIFLVDNKAAEAHLIDFGVAKHEGKDLTHTGQLIGTPGYMAPEQVRGDKGLSASADLFALGCVLYRALSGRDAFEGAEVMEILARLLLEDPPPLEQLVPEIPPRFAHLVSSLLSKDATRRLGDAAIASDELRAIRRALETRDDSALALRPDAIPTPVPANSATLTLRGKPRRSKTWMIAIGALVVVAAVAVVVVVRPWASPSRTAALEEAARIAEAAGKHDVALQAYLDAYAIDPDPRLLFSIAEQFEATKQTEEAIRHFERYLQEAKDPPNRPAIEKRIEQLRLWYEAELRMIAPPACDHTSSEGCGKACEVNDGQACYRLARTLHGRDDHEPARIADIKACRLGVNLGCVEAAKSLFAMVKHIPKARHAAVLAEAEAQLVTACDRKHWDACRRLGRAVSKGQGPLPPDPPRAFALVELACNNDEKAACQVLPTMAADEKNGATKELRDGALRVHRAACARGLPDIGCVR